MTLDDLRVSKLKGHCFFFKALKVPQLENEAENVDYFAQSTN